MKIFFTTMAFDKWTLLYSSLLLLVTVIGNIEAQSCGGNYTANYGVFTSPNYPNVYNVSSTCYYTIMLSTNSSITFNFETFELDRSSSDYVAISCASNSSFSQKTYYWNTNIPPISIPWCSSGKLKFYSDSSHNYTTRGFRVQYQVNTIGCGNTVYTGSSATISSPNYPNNYNNNENCTYSIRATQPSSFTLTFQAFSLESDCQHDWVQIRCDNTSYVLPKYCGSTLPKPAYIKNCNKVLIWFHTDASNVFSGFRLQYSYILSGCGKVSNAGLTGVITSPNYPQQYSGIDCTYSLYPVSSVALAFQSFDLEPFIDNSYGDYIQVHCYTPNEGSKTYRGVSLPPLISYTMCSHVHLHFNPNDALSGTGFKVEYQVNPLVAYGAITNKPINMASYVGTRVQLDCTSNVTGYLPSWTWSRDGTDENTTVIASFCAVNPGYTSQYSVVKGEQGVCNLVITNATLARAGVYTCIDVSLASFSTIVSVIEVVFTVSKQPEVVKGDIIKFQYSVKFNGSVAPAPILPMLYYWNSTGKSVVISNTTLPNIVISSIDVTAEPENVPSYGFMVTFSAPMNRKDYASNAPAYIYSRFSTSYVVLYWPEASNMTITGDNNSYIAYNGLLQCSVSSNPPSNYSWLDQTSGIYTSGSTANVTHSGMYICDASNVIRSKTYLSSKSITVYILVPTTSTTDQGVIIIVLAVLLSISVLGNIGIAIFWKVRRYRPNSSEEDIRNPTENEYTTTSATIPTYANLPNQVLSADCSMTTDTHNRSQYEYLNHVFDNPAVYESLQRQKVSTISYS